MSTATLLSSLAPLLERAFARIAAQAQTDPELRAAVLALADALTAAAGADPSTRAAEAAVTTEHTITSAVAVAIPADAPPAPPSPRTPVTIDDIRRIQERIAAEREEAFARERERSEHKPIAPAASPLPGPSVTFAKLADRLRIKAELCAAMAAAPDGLSAEIQAGFEQRARAAGAILWMSGQPFEPGALEPVAACYDTLAQMCAALPELLRAELPAKELLELLLMVAQAQSAVRAALQDCSANVVDADQEVIFLWIKTVTKTRHLFVGRYMRVTDPADPADDRLLRERWSSWAEARVRPQQRERARSKGLKRIAFHARSLTEGAPLTPDNDWAVIDQTVVELVQEGVPPSDVLLREKLLPLAPLRPEGFVFAPQTQLAWREVEAQLERANAADDDDHDAEAEQWSSQVAHAADLLRGRTLILIGGDRRPEAATALEHAFGLDELLWLATRPHEGWAWMEPYMARESVAAVVFMVRWASHGQSDVKALCERHGKPFVYLTRGYNPNRIAHELLAQASARLAPADGASTQS